MHIAHKKWDDSFLLRLILTQRQPEFVTLTKGFIHSIEKEFLPSQFLPQVKRISNPKETSVCFCRIKVDDFVTMITVCLWAITTHLIFPNYFTMLCIVIWQMAFWVITAIASFVCIVSPSVVINSLSSYCCKIVDRS